MIVMRQPGERSTGRPPIPSLDELAEVLDLDGLGWQDSALCAQTDPEVFFPALGSPGRDAKRVCRLCPVRAECLEYAIETRQAHGIWGGTSEKQREAVWTGRKSLAEVA